MSEQLRIRVVATLIGMIALGWGGRATASLLVELSDLLADEVASVGPGAMGDREFWHVQAEQREFTDVLPAGGLTGDSVSHGSVATSLVAIQGAQVICPRDEILLARLGGSKLLVPAPNRSEILRPPRCLRGDDT